MASHLEEEGRGATGEGEDGAAADQAGGAQDKRSGYCKETGVYRSLHCLGPRRRFPADPRLDTASFVLSRLPHIDHAHSQVALVDSATGQRVTYAQLRRSVRALAAALHHALGVRGGDVVFLLSPNSVLYPVVCLAVLLAGGVLTTANPLNTAAEVAKQVRDSGAKLAIVAPEEVHKVATAGVPVLLATRRKDGNNDGSGDLLSVEELIEGGDPSMAPAKSPCGQHDPAAILYSSGTTGASKGVVLTHGNLIAILTLLQWAVEVTASRGDVFLAFLPMFHVYGLAFFALGLFCCAGPPTVVVMPRFDLGLALDAVARHGVTNIAAVPPVLLGLVRAAASGGHDLSRLRRVGTGAAPMGGSLGRAFREAYPWVELREGYGLTESGGAATFFVSAGEAKRREGSVGRLMPGYAAKVVEADGEQPLAPGGVGELWLSGPGVMKGYLGDEAATQAALVEAGGVQWLRTGDLCYFDEDGFLYVVDRIKELIKHNGYQVAPAELEALLLSHPHVLDAAVIPLEDEEAGQIPMAYVVRSQQGGVSEEDLIHFVASQVAPYKKIRRVAFIDSIPRSAAGKILRRQLVARSDTAVASKL